MMQSYHPWGPGEGGMGGDSQAFLGLACAFGKLNEMFNFQSAPTYSIHLIRESQYLSNGRYITLR